MIYRIEFEFELNPFGVGLWNNPTPNTAFQSKLFLKIKSFSRTISDCRCAAA